MANMKEFTSDMIEPLVIGGCILGGGGGGSMKKGREMAALSLRLGTPTFLSVDELEEQDTVLTVSAVGAPAAPNQYIEAIDYAKTVEQFINVTGTTPKAMMTNENGGSASVNGLLQSVITGIPLLDAACNGRAHPTGIMGSMGLNELPGYESVQVAIGGKPGTDFRVQMVVKGTIHSSAALIRQAAVQAGGLVGVARNPVTVAYLKEQAAVGAISHAIEVGEAHGSGSTPLEQVENVVNVLGGSILSQGKVKNLQLETINGFDVGRLVVEEEGSQLDLTFWNEYMTADRSGDRIATFPDLMMTFSTETGLPVTTAELYEGQEVFVIQAPYQKLILGSGMRLESNYHAVEKVLNVSIIPYIKPLFR